MDHVLGRNATRRQRAPDVVGARMLIEEPVGHSAADGVELDPLYDLVIAVRPGFLLVEEVGLQHLELHRDG
ncbi:hypothetical protein D3C85_1509950 [compost metagenome]